LASFGYSEEKIASDRQKISDYDSANQLQESLKGASTTRDQDSSMKAMNAWLAQYFKIAKVVLRDKKQLLEKIGVAARTSKTAAQKNSAKKTAAATPAK